MASRSRIAKGCPFSNTISSASVDVAGMHLCWYVAAGRVQLLDIQNIEAAANDQRGHAGWNALISAPCRAMELGICHHKPGHGSGSCYGEDTGRKASAGVRILWHYIG